MLLRKWHFGSLWDCHIIRNILISLLINPEAIWEYRGRAVLFFKIKDISLHCYTYTFLEIQILDFKFFFHLQMSSLFLDVSQPYSHLDINLILLWLFSTCRFTYKESAPLPLPEHGPTVTVLRLQQLVIPCLPGVPSVTTVHFSPYAFLPWARSAMGTSALSLHQTNLPLDWAVLLSLFRPEYTHEFLLSFVLPFILAPLFPLW